MERHSREVRLWVLALMRARERERAEREAQARRVRKALRAEMDKQVEAATGEREA